MKHPLRRWQLVNVATCLILVVLQCVPCNAARADIAGISTGTSLLWLDDATLNQRLNDIQSLGATWVRIDFNWSEVQRSGYDTFNWQGYDRVVTAVTEHKLKVLGTLVYVPAWARSKNCSVASEQNLHERVGRACSPRNPNEFGRFARAAAMRFQPHGIYVWEIWNEPNMAAYFLSYRHTAEPSIDPGIYAAIANTAAREIKSADPGAFVITGGLAPSFESSKKGMNQAIYLRRLLPLLNKNLFDAVGVHPYSWPKLPSSAVVYNAFLTVDGGRPQYNLRHIMTKAGWEDKQLWATEFGAPTRGKRLFAVHSQHGLLRQDHVSEQAQAEIIAQGIRLWSKKYNTGPIFVHSDSDSWLIGHSESNNTSFGLRRQDGTQKPGYAAYKSAVSSVK